jgi:hypothetical protein
MVVGGTAAPGRTHLAWVVQKGRPGNASLPHSPNQSPHHPTLEAVRARSGAHQAATFNSAVLPADPGAHNYV